MKIITSYIAMYKYGYMFVTGPEKPVVLHIRFGLILKL